MRATVVAFVTAIHVAAASASGQPHEAPRHLEIPLSRRAGSGRRLEGYTELGEIKREPDGVYWSDLKIGDPPQMFSVIVDTGSSTIAVPCKGCSCGPHRHFDTTDANVLQSQYSQCYSEGSCNRGSYVQAKMCLGEACDVLKEGVEHRFGCCSQFASAFKRQEADGIIGMSGSSGTLLSDLREHHKLEQDMFSLCLSDTVGILGVGGYDPTRHLEPLQWIPMRSSSFYEVDVSAIYVGGTALEVSLPTPIVDSGTTFTYVPDKVHQEIRERLVSWCDAEEGRCPGTRNPSFAAHEDIRDAIMCWGLPDGVDHEDLDDWLAKFPPIELKFSEYEGSAARICIPSQTYFYRSKEAYCIGLLQGRSKFVLGAITMSGFDYVFDHEHARLGLARSLCDKGESMSDVALRKSPANCCGSCAKAQSEGYNKGAKVTSQPTKSPTTSLPTASPTPRIVAVGNVTDDGFFHKVRDAPNFEEWELLVPVDGSAWNTSQVAIGAGQAVFVQSNATLCHSNTSSWSWDPAAALVVSGHEVIVSLGSFCKYSNVIVVDGGRADSNGAQVVGDGPNTVEISRNLSLTRGSFVVVGGSTLVMGTDAEIVTTPTAILSIEAHGRFECSVKRGDGIDLEHGFHTVYAPATLACFLTVGNLATLNLVASRTTKEPVQVHSDLQIQGTLEMTMRKNPFNAFVLLSNKTVTWDHHFDTTFKIAFHPDEEEDIIHDLPEIARVVTLVNEKYEVDLPTHLDLPPEFRCSGSNITDDFMQIVFTAEDCFNRCIDEDDAQPCTAEERERYEWPPRFPSQDGLFDAFDNSSLAVYYNSLLDQIGVNKDPVTRHTAAGGTIGGIIVAVLLFLAVYPPACLRRVICCCRGGRTYDRL